MLRPDRSTDGICGLRCWPAGKRRMATHSLLLRLQPHPSASPASLLVPVVSFVLQLGTAV
jgi:hypothetical protein